MVVLILDHNNLHFFLPVTAYYNTLGKSKPTLTYGDLSTKGLVVILPM